MSPYNVIMKSRPKSRIFDISDHLLTRWQPPIKWNSRFNYSLCPCGLITLKLNDVFVEYLIKWCNLSIHTSFIHIEYALQCISRYFACDTLQIKSLDLFVSRYLSSHVISMIISQGNVLHKKHVPILNTSQYSCHSIINLYCSINVCNIIKKSNCVT